jgi:hypothetical protein
MRCRHCGKRREDHYGKMDGGVCCNPNGKSHVFEPSEPAPIAQTAVCPDCKQEMSRHRSYYDGIECPQPSPAISPAEQLPSELPPVRIRTISAEDARLGLEGIFGYLQKNFHDQWDWMKAHFYLAILGAEIGDSKEGLSAALAQVKALQEEVDGSFQRERVLSHDLAALRASRDELLETVRDYRGGKLTSRELFESM